MKLLATIIIFCSAVTTWAAGDTQSLYNFSQLLFHSFPAGSGGYVIQRATSTCACSWGSTCSDPQVKLQTSSENTPGDILISLKVDSKEIDSFLIFSQTVSFLIQTSSTSGHEDFVHDGSQEIVTTTFGSSAGSANLNLQSAKGQSSYSLSNFALDGNGNPVPGSPATLTVQYHYLSGYDSATSLVGSCVIPLGKLLPIEP